MKKEKEPKGLANGLDVVPATVDRRRLSVRGKKITWNNILRLLPGSDYQGHIEAR